MWAPTRFTALLLCSLALLVACEDDEATGNGATNPSAQATATEAAQPAPTLTASNLQVATTVSGLDTPTQLVFLGADDLLVTQKKGQVVRVTRGAVAGTVLQLATNFADERGVLGIAKHPQFDTNRFVYIYWTWSGEGSEPAGLSGAATDDIEKVPALGNRVDRFVWDGSKLTFDRNIVRLPSKTTDLTQGRRRGNHDAGVIKFGPDGKLYIANGDQNVRGQLTNVTDGAQLRGPEDLVAAVLRLNDDGSTPSDNPFASAGPEAAKIWIYGLRNTFGFTFDRRTGSFWLQVNGQAAYDEIGRYTAGDNLGWIQLMGPPARVASYKEIEVKTERQLDSPAYAPGRLADNAADAMSRLYMLPGATYRAPVFSWKYVIAPTDIEFIDSTRFGAELDGDMLVGTVLTGMLLRFDLNTERSDFVLSGPLEDRVDDNTAAGQLGEVGDAHILGRGFGVVTDIATAPDGTIWVASLSGNALYQIAPR